MSVVQPVPRGAFEVAGMRLLDLLADYYELVGCLLVVGGLTGWAGYRYGQEAAVTTAIAGVVGLVLFVVFVARGVVNRGCSRRRHNNFVRSWPALCDLLGWSQVLSTHADGHPSGEVKPAKVPDLIEFGRFERGVWLVIKPLASQPRDTWPKMADALAREKGFPHQLISEPKPGLLKITLIAAELPTFVGFDPAVHEGQVWDRIRLAINAAGDLAEWVVSDIPHMLVGGSTKGGKGSILRLAMRHCLVTGWYVVAINPKGSGEFGWAKRLGVPVVSDVDSAGKVVEWVFNEMVRRQGIVEVHDVGEWTQLPPNLQEPPLMVVVDEGSSLLTPNKASKEMAGVQLQIGDRLTRISMAGRAVGVHLLLAAQRPDVQNLGPSGGQLRMNMDARAAVCSIDGDGKRMMFDGLDDPDILRTLDGTKGRTVLAKLQAGSMDAFPAQTIYQSETDLLDAPPKVRILQLGANQKPLHIDAIKGLKLSDRAA